MVFIKLKDQIESGEDGRDFNPDAKDIKFRGRRIRFLEL